MYYLDYEIIYDCKNGKKKKQITNRKQNMKVL